MEKIAPISGFPEFAPAEQIALSSLERKIAHVAETFGYVPLQTPIVERKAHLLAKGIEEKEVYGLHRLRNPEGQDSTDALALRFDLTVPLARYVAQHYGGLTFPFRRYQIQPVWRGERPQSGRFRQFTQCDMDIVGDGKLSNTHDAEIVALIYHTLDALDFGGFTIRLNNRKVLNGLFASMGMESALRESMSAVDDLEKIGTQAVQARLVGLGMTQEDAIRLIGLFADKAEAGRNGIHAKLKTLRAMDVNDMFANGVQELCCVAETALEFIAPEPPAGFAPPACPVRSSRMRPDECLQIDLSIARGLDYYTGTVFETRLNDHPNLGSICSGGRYDDLAGNFINKTLPGVGMSIGLTRLASWLLSKNLLQASTTSVAPVMVCVQEPETLKTCSYVAGLIRSAGINAELYLEPRKLKAQLRAADQRGVAFAVFGNAEELAAGQVHVKALRLQQEDTVTFGQLGPTLRLMMPPEIY